jgi:urea carboxylase-associated protein 2
MSDTLKAQHTFFLSKDLACYSDMGRVLLSFVDDTVGWHDTVTGVSNAAVVEEKYGVKTYQKYRNNRHRNGSDNLLVELGKHGLGPRDLAAPINLFTKIQPDENTSLTYVADHSPAGSSVTLRADMNTLVVGTAVQHPLDPNPEYNPKSVKLEILAGEPAPQDDPCRQASDESGRAFTLTDHYFLGAP